MKLRDFQTHDKNTPPTSLSEMVPLRQMVRYFLPLLPWQASFICIF